jgi:hypothetical protein
MATKRGTDFEVHLCVGQVLSVFFPVQKSIELCLNKGSLVALQWMVSKYLHLVLRQMKRYCAYVTCMNF